MHRSEAPALVIEFGEGPAPRDGSDQTLGAAVRAISARPSRATAIARERLPKFLARLRRMSKSERILASRYQFSLWELNVWTAQYQEEVPRINGEFEWIATTLADNE